jgi:kumamolisin
VFGGTSVATPIWAGLMGLVNQARFTAKLPSVGFLDPRIYPLLGSKNFRDIVSGNNGGYSALKGYDLVTGIGTPLTATLLATLVAQK